MYKIFIVEDDRNLASLISDIMEKWEMEGVISSNFSDILSEFFRVSPQLILMDVSLPYKNGYYWCGEIRKVSNVPIIFISSASDNLNIVMAMNMGGDDYITKPFDSDVLVAKVQALLRRTYNFSAPINTFEHRGAILNIDDGTLYYNGTEIELSKNELRILSVLMKNKGKTVSREKLMEKLWQTDEFVDDNALTVNIGRLRRKLEKAGLSAFIETKFGVGYKIG